MILMIIFTIDSTAVGDDISTPTASLFSPNCSQYLDANISKYLTIYALTVELANIIASSTNDT